MNMTLYDTETEEYIILDDTSARYKKLVKEKLKNGKLRYTHSFTFKEVIP